MLSFALLQLLLHKHLLQKGSLLLTESEKHFVAWNELQHERKTEEDEFPQTAVNFFKHLVECTEFDKILGDTGTKHLYIHFTN